MIEDDTMYPAAEVKRQLKMVPKCVTIAEVFDEILKLAEDNRQHVMLSDCIAFLELKMKAVAILVKQGKKLTRSPVVLLERTQ